MWQSSPLRQVVSADAADEEGATSTPEYTLRVDHSGPIEAGEHLDATSNNETSRNEMDLAILELDDLHDGGSHQELDPPGDTVEEMDKEEMGIEDIRDLGLWTEFVGEDDNACEGVKSAEPTGAIGNDTPEAVKDASLLPEKENDAYKVYPDEGYATGPSWSATPEETGKKHECLSSDPTTVFHAMKDARGTSNLVAYITETAMDGWSYISNNPWRTTSFLVATGILVGGTIRLARGR